MNDGAASNRHLAGSVSGVGRFQCSSGRFRHIDAQVQDRHDLVELAVSVQFEGDFDARFLSRFFQRSE
jgi:hypothetical protein